MFWFQPEHFELRWGKFRRCSMPGPRRVRAKVQDMMDGDVTREEARAPRGCALLQLCRLAHVLHAERVGLA